MLVSRDVTSSLPAGEREVRRPLFVLRCALPDYWRDRIHDGTDQSGLGRAPSRSWWQHGALVVDEAGPALIDADGLRVPIPVPATGGVLVRLAVTADPVPIRPHPLAAQPGRRPRLRGQAPPPPPKPSGTVYLNFICGPGGKVTVRLPGQEEGFSDEAMASFAKAAGLRYEQRDKKSLKKTSGLHTSLDLRACVDDAAYRATLGARVKRMLRVQGRRSPYEEPYKSRYPATAPPYQLPET
jgi:hypothetical protein